MIDTDEIVNELNEHTQTVGSPALTVGRVIMKRAIEMEHAQQRDLLRSIKENPNLKLTPGYVYDCYRMVLKNPPMMQPDWKPKINLTISHYFEISRIRISEGAVELILGDANEMKWSVLKVIKEARATKNQPDNSQQIERRDILSDIRKILSNRTNEELATIRKDLRNKYDSTGKEK